jgi:hypothetical protein
LTSDDEEEGCEEDEEKVVVVGFGGDASIRPNDLESQQGIHDYVGEDDVERLFVMEKELYQRSLQYSSASQLTPHQSLHPRHSSWI